MPIKKIVHYITVAALFLIPIFPLIVANSYFFPFITGKAFYFRLLVELAFSAWVILAFYDPRYRPKFTYLNVAVTLFALIALVADLIGVNPLRSIWSNFERMEGWLVIVHLWAFYMVATSIFGHGPDGKRIWHLWLNTSIGFALIVAIYGLFQLFGYAEIHQGSSRLDASLGNSAYLAVYMLFHVFISAYLFFESRIIVGKKNRKINPMAVVYGVLSILFAFILLQTQTRGTILGLIGGVMLALAVYAVFGKKESKKWRVASASILGFIVLSGVLFWFNREQPWIQKNQILGRFTNISWNQPSNQARQIIWPMAISGAMERPILGWGQENFNYIFNSKYNPVMYSQEQWFDRAHSVFLDWLVAAGILGVTAYLSLYFLFLVSVWKSDLSIKHKSILTGLLAGYFVHNIFVFDNLTSYVMFFAVLGLANSFNEGATFKWLSVKPVREDVVEYVVAPITIVALAFVLYFVQYRPVEANTRLIAALQSCGGPTPDVSAFGRALSINSYMANQEIREQVLACAGNVVSNEQVSMSTRQVFFQLAKSQIEAQTSATPKDARIYTLGGVFMSNVNQLAEAVSLLEKAHELSPGKQTIAMELANAYINTGKTDEAVKILKEAYESEPNYFQAKMAYAMSLVLAGKEREAIEKFNNDPAIFRTAQMAQVYANLKQYSKAEAIYTYLAKENPKDVNNRSRLAQLQYMLGKKYAAIETLRAISNDNIELKAQIDAAIKQIESEMK